LNIKQWLIKLRRSKYIERLLQFIFLVATKLPVRKKTIVFESFLGKQFSDNPKALYEYIKKHYPDYTLYWSFDRQYRKNFEGKNLNSLPRFGIKWIFVMARANYWITNSRLPLWLPKSKNTIYVQTWHGTPLKKLGLDMDEVHMPGTDTESYKSDFKTEASKWNYLISPNAYSTQIFKRAFDFRKTVIESGYPRNDILYTHNNEQSILEIKAKLNIPLDKKVILYAPTWRDDDYYRVGQYKFTLQLDLNKLQNKLGDDYVVLLRMHYLVAEKLELSGHEDFVYDFSTYNDINELYLVSDLLITDYSSVFFDYANLKRPTIFYVYDLDDYRDRLRGFYFDLEAKAPGPLVKTTDEVISVVKRAEQHDFIPAKKVGLFYDEFCYLDDGQASKRVAEKLFKI